MGSVTGATVVVGNNNTVTTSTQTGASLPDLVHLVAEMRALLQGADLDPDTHAVVEGSFQVVEEQLKKPQPKKALVLPSLKQIAETLALAVTTGEAVGKLKPMLDQAILWAQALLEVAMNRRRYNPRFLLAGILLSVLIFIASLLLFPTWGSGISTLLALLALAVTAAFGFLANFRQAVEEPSNLPFLPFRQPSPPAVGISSTAIRIRSRWEMCQGQPLSLATIPPYNSTTTAQPSTPPPCAATTCMPCSHRSTPCSSAASTPRRPAKAVPVSASPPSIPPC
jgi:hypothetical protein